MITTALLLKVVEATLFEEIAKWVVMGIVLLIILAGILYAPAGLFGSRYNAFKKNHPGEKHVFWKYIVREFFSKKTIWED